MFQLANTFHQVLDHPVSKPLCSLRASLVTVGSLASWRLTLSRAGIPRVRSSCHGLASSELSESSRHGRIAPLPAGLGQRTYCFHPLINCFGCFCSRWISVGGNCMARTYIISNVEGKTDRAICILDVCRG